MVSELVVSDDEVASSEVADVGGLHKMDHVAGGPGLPKCWILAGDRNWQEPLWTHRQYRLTFTCHFTAFDVTIRCGDNFFVCCVYKCRSYMNRPGGRDFPVSCQCPDDSDVTLSLGATLREEKLFSVS